MAPFDKHYQTLSNNIIWKEGFANCGKYDRSNIFTSQRPDLLECIRSELPRFHPSTPKPQWVRDSKRPGFKPLLDIWRYLYDSTSSFQLTWTNPQLTSIAWSRPPARPASAIGARCALTAHVANLSGGLTSGRAMWEMEQKIGPSLYVTTPKWGSMILSLRHTCSFGVLYVVQEW